MTAAIDLTLIAALGCALNGGVFFAFSTFVMQGLARLPAAQGIAAMQSINITAVRPLFMTALFGTALLCVMEAIAAAMRWPAAGSGYVVAGSLVYIAGTPVVTMICNVPRNSRLARLDPLASGSEPVWSDYLREWTRWNHVRTVSGVVAAALLLLGRQ